MSDRTELCIHIGGNSGRAAGFMSMGCEGVADISYRPGEYFPFEDRSVGALAIDMTSVEWHGGERARFLLECRRVITPGGLARFIVSPNTPDASDLPRLAAAVGLDPARSFPVAARWREAIQAISGGQDCADVDFTKRNRLLVGEPLVTVLVPAYNPRFFAICVDSALAQTYPNVEIVVCDDSSGNAIEDLCDERAARGVIRYLRNEQRLGPRGNFRRCFESARGDFVKFLCDDDVLAAGCVATLVDAFRRAPDIVLATSHRRRIDERGNDLPDQPATAAVVRRNTVVAGYTLANAMLMAGLNIVGEPSTALFRRSELADRAPDYFVFNGEHGHGVIDMVTWTALLLKGDAVFVRERLSGFRIHPAQRQHDPAKQERNIASIRGLQTAWLELGAIAPVAADTLLCKPFPPVGGADWKTQRVVSFASRPAVPSALQPIGLAGAGP